MSKRAFAYGHPAVVNLIVVLASVFSAVSGFPPDTSCKKKVIPSATHLPVSDVPVGIVRAKSTPSGETTCTSTVSGPTEVHDSLVTPSPVPSQTRIGFGSAVMVAFFPFVAEPLWLVFSQEQLAIVKREPVKTNSPQ